MSIRCTLFQTCTIPFYLFNLDRVYDRQKPMHLKWLDVTDSPTEIQKYSYWADPKPQSDSNWDTSAFIYKPKPGCDNCEPDNPALTLNFRFEVSMNKTDMCQTINLIIYFVLNRENTRAM